MILVTGAGGFLGSRLVAHLLSVGFNVLPVYRGHDLRIASDRWEADLTRKDHMVRLCEVEQAPHTVIHLAGRIEISLEPSPLFPVKPPVPGREDIYALYHANVLATANVLDYCLYKGVKHIIYASSQAVYGIPTSEHLTEESECLPLEHYAVSKLCGEHILKIGSVQGINVTTLRFPGLYGEERTEGVVYRFCQSALQEGTIQINTKFPLPIDVIHINDVINAFEKTVCFGGDGWTCLNIATGEPCSLDLLAESIAELVPGCIVRYSEISQPVVCMDSAKAHKTMGWRALGRRERLLDMISQLRGNN